MAWLVALELFTFRKDINENACGTSQALPSVFVLDLRMTRARNFGAFGDGGLHETVGFHSRRSHRFGGRLVGFSGPVKKNSLPANQNCGKVI